MNIDLRAYRAKNRQAYNEQNASSAVNIPLEPRNKGAQHERHGSAPKIVRKRVETPAYVPVAMPAGAPTKRGRDIASSNRARGQRPKWSD